MKALAKILLPAAVAAAVAAGVSNVDNTPVKTFSVKSPDYIWHFEPSRDTILYPRDAYRLRRKGKFDEISVTDSSDRSEDCFLTDTIPQLTARDTIVAPDSLRLTDPFRYKYYVALLDSLTHVQVRDSLKLSAQRHLFDLDTLMARADSADRFKLDSLYCIDSTARARAAFILWYSSLDKDARKKYDNEQKMLSKKAEMDSLRDAKEERQAIRDSITENTPRILATFALPDSMLYKRIITWTTDPDFHKMKVEIPDTSFNKYFYDYPFQRKDVNSTWLGMAGSPVQSYNYFKRGTGDPADFITPNEPWTFSMSNLDWYNTKTPYTELAYWGTLIGTRSKESDNIHLFTTQNILPELNFRLSFDRWGGSGMLDREETANKTAVAAVNYLGKRYKAHLGYIHNNVSRQENGGITDDSFIRDTILELREIPINLLNSNSNTRKNSVFLEQQFSIPFTFINDLRARKDSSFVADSSDINDITTAFIGHTSEFTDYSRKYDDICDDPASKEFYRNTFNYGNTASADSQRVAVLHNKVFIRLQPWSRDAIVSKLDIGIGDYLRNYYSPSREDPLIGSKVTQNTAYLYAGAEGQIKKYFQWDAKADYAFAGTDARDFGIQANARVNMYPFRRDRNSPLSIGARFETSLRSPNYYQQHTFSNHFQWDNQFTKQSVTKIQGDIDIPHWKMNASVGYALVANSVYYDSLSIARQCPDPVSIFTASLRKDIVLGGIVHLDNRILFQLSSNQDVIPVPMLAFNLKYFAEFVAARDRATHTQNVLVMQIGVNALYNTKWHSPAWNPNLGVFYNQNRFLYENGPHIDAFVNMQWKRACIFLKFENIGGGWPMERKDFFSAAHFVSTKNTFKIGIFWPFYTQPGKNGHSHNHGNGSRGGSGSGSGSGSVSGSGAGIHNAGSRALSK